MNILAIYTVFWTILIIQLAESDQRRPFWNIAHMVNSVSQVLEYIDLGANGIEADVTFDRSGTPQYTYHGIPCDCFRRCLRWSHFDDYLDYIAQVANKDSPLYREALVLFVLDLKLESLSSSALISAGRKLAETLRKHYWKKDFMNMPYVIISVPTTSSWRFLKSFLSYLKENLVELMLQPMFGFDVYMNEDLDIIERMYINLNIHSNIWQSDGITNCLPRLKTRLREAVSRRDSAEYRHIDKIYYWTSDRKESMRNILRITVDAAMTNRPHALRQVLAEAEFVDSYRLATSEDNPWITFNSNRFQKKSSEQKYEESSPRKQRELKNITKRMKSQEEEPIRKMEKLVLFSTNENDYDSDNFLINIDDDDLENIWTQQDMYNLSRIMFH